MRFLQIYFILFYSNVSNTIISFFQVKTYSIKNYYSNIVFNIFGISQNPVTKDYIIVLQDGCCEKCDKQYTDIIHKWCKSCEINELKNNFSKWTSVNETIDNLIQEMQLKIESYEDTIFEWIPYIQFNNINETGKDSLYLATWKDGPLYYYSDVTIEYKKVGNVKVALGWPCNITYMV